MRFILFVINSSQNKGMLLQFSKICILIMFKKRLRAKRHNATKIWTMDGQSIASCKAHASL